MGEVLSSQRVGVPGGGAGFTKCWSFMERDEVKEGDIAIELYVIFLKGAGLSTRRVGVCRARGGWRSNKMLVIHGAG